MPGEIGASIFSPRPARGYRFHSLQVEIIHPPRSTERRYRWFLSVSRQHFVPRSERLTWVSVPET
jgi:hypothetical protein